MPAFLCDYILLRLVNDIVDAGSLCRGTSTFIQLNMIQYKKTTSFCFHVPLRISLTKTAVKPQFDRGVTAVMLSFDRG